MSMSETATDKRTIGDIIVEALTQQGDNTPVCIVHENMLNISRTKKGTKLTLGLPNNVFSPDDAMWFTGEMGRPRNRRPKYVGYLVFVPIDIARIDTVS